MVRNTSNIAHHCSLFAASSPTVLLYSYRLESAIISLTFRKPARVSIVYRHADRR